MKKLIILLTFCSLLFSCSNGGNASSSNTPTTNMPIGTTIKLECSISSGSTIPSVQYKDAQQNLISLGLVPNNWTITFQTTSNNQQIMLNSSGGSYGTVTGKIYINGTLMKTATGNMINMLYP